MGGGLLETNNQLERFTKNKKSKKLTYSIIGILVIIGSITLFKTYAFFEEKREFNVLKGKVPEFNRSDITLALTLDGQEVENYPDKGNYKVNILCDNEAVGNWDYEEWALKITNLKNKKIKCQIDFTTPTLYNSVQVGQFISYTPEKTSYEIASNLTGYTSNQTINPSELNLWRVIRKNEDGSIDLVSEYTSSQNVIFKGEIGYKNYIGTLNKVAQSYETSGITSRSRYMGYDGQTEFILSSEKITDTEPWTEDTTAENSPKGSERERLGGGDVLYLTDEALIKAACGNTLIAYKVDATSTAVNYWLASRYFIYQYDYWSFFNIRYVSTNDRLSGDEIFYGSDKETRSINYLRPIVTLESGIVANTGNGSSENPWKIN
ncbi:MAG: hypothetical protein HFJ02_06940 [Bacilli bacterium]|nr:hypothetical protein [Bacilli bacterium]